MATGASAQVSPATWCAALLGATRREARERLLRCGARHERDQEHERERERERAHDEQPAGERATATAAGFYLDMLNDRRRNAAFGAAVSRATFQGARVLDAGTGCGVWAVVAARAGAAHVLAADAAAPFAAAARDVARNNGCGDTVRVAANLTTDLELSPAEAPFDVVVGELFDSALLGEGCLPTLRDAGARLLRRPGVTVPHGATVFAQLVESEHVLGWRHLAADCALAAPAGVAACRARAGPEQTDARRLLRDGLAVPVCEPFAALEFEFAEPPAPGEHARSVSVTPHRSGLAHAVLSWWEIRLDADGKLVLSTDPRDGTRSSACPGAHWLAVAHVLAEPLVCVAGEARDVFVHHDDAAVWFSGGGEAIAMPGPCTCGLHTACPRQRLGMLNDDARNFALAAAAAQTIQAVDPGAAVACVGDGPLLPVLAASFAAESATPVVALTRGDGAAELTRTFLAAEGVEHPVLAVEEGTPVLGYRLGAVLAEPWFSGNAGSWGIHATLRARAVVRELREAKRLLPGARVSPHTARVRGVAIECEELWRRRQLPETVAGVEITDFWPLLPAGEVISLPFWEWEAAYAPLTAPFELLRVGLADEADPSAAVSAKVTTAGTCHAVLLWVDYELAGDEGDASRAPRDDGWDDAPQVVSTGPHVPWAVQGCWLHAEPQVVDMGGLVTARSSLVGDALQLAFRFLPAVADPELD